ncbi:Oxygen sensor histidine kinase response regulator DevS/DosS [Austwickia sp. TVS 96-490-7B]|uniref:sensor histidine kinase n=1 Tax=Austwickia sp. TVS 96-490-7B TaxID=2830843 RepID=UPI001DB2DB19|nr:GAF domain-containing protein [Austwickia sp. TVS 96-490-7B]MBW3086416.1 Oxygen sensor histidine kinase response regulator DevS/DosS [Austwickia sp. TVS 96-490-7B]
MSDAVESSTAGRLAPVAALDIDDLLAEIRSRAAGAQQSQERLAGLLDAVIAVSSDLDLPTVLSRIVSSACALVDASYGALGVVDESGRHLVEFITHGMEEGAQVMSEPPTGQGVLGLLLSDPVSLRLSHVSAHPSSLKTLPPGHPPVDSFVGAPIRVRDHIFGNLYLTQKKGAPEFSEEDEQLIAALAAAAGIAIDKAQLYRRARRTRDWARAVGELTQTLLEGRNEHGALARMVKRARDLGDAELALVATMQDDTGTLMIRAVDGIDGVSDALVHSTLQSARWRIVLANRVPLLLMTDAEDAHVGELSAEIRDRAGLSPVGASAIVPIIVGDVELGLIVLCWPADGLRDALDTIESLTSFAEQMGLALEAARAQRSRSRTVLLEDRDRIARDMHDHVIQRLYATGLSLQSAARRTDGVVRERIDTAVDQLDAAVKDIRQAIFELHHQIPEGGLGPELEAIVESASEGFGFIPDVTFEALADIPMEYEADVLAVVRESLSNIVRHAHATDAHVSVSAVDDIVITVRDNGIGIPEGAARSGLVNLRERAEARGGSCHATGLDPVGSEVMWRVPLPGRLLHLRER